MCMSKLNKGLQVLVAGTCINLTIGVLYAWSVIKKALVNDWGWTNTDASMPYNVAIVVWAVALLIAGALQDRIGPKKVITLGVVLVGLGMILSSMIPQDSVLGLTVAFGGVVGTGIGFAYACVTPSAMRHIDPFGFLIMIVPPHIGWARPVPVDARYFKNPRTGMLLVAIAGPAANVLVAGLCAALYHAIGSIPLAETDELAVRVLLPLVTMAQAGVFVSLLIGAFNLLPIPPLDGSNIVARLLPERLAWRYLDLGRYGILFIIGLMILGNFAGVSLFGTLLFPVVGAAAEVLGMGRIF